MINPKDLENLEFDKSFMGGYSVESVDEFIYTLNSDYEALFIENGELKKKLAVLASKIEEYKKDDEYIKGSIIYSQKIRDDALNEAKLSAEDYFNSKKAEADKLVKEADEYKSTKCSTVDSEYEAERREIESKLRLERNELAMLKNKVCDFRENLKAVYDRELEAIMSIPVFDKEETKIEEEVKEPEMVIEEVVAEEIKTDVPADFISDIAEVISEKELEEDKINPLDFKDETKAKTLEQKIDLVLGDDTLIASKGFDFPLKK
ncbi:MAG: DivIVA domain-containing protein [Clostridia bacterium]